MAYFYKTNFQRPANVAKVVMNRRLIVAALTGLITGVLLTTAFMKAGRDNWPSYPLSFYKVKPLPIHLEAILHYAKSNKIPQQSEQEIMQSLNVLRTGAPCNFLVFGLGYDSLMWASFNAGGSTLFLEESPEWVQTVLKDTTYLRAKTVSYRTDLSEASELLKSYKGEPYCLPSKTYLKGNFKCKLALENLPDEVYDTQWDVIMIDAPRGWESGQPGRMAAIYTAAVMARARKGPGNTHVYLHDVNREVEKIFAQEFLCIKYKVGSVGRLWHFEIPPAQNNASSTFC